MESFSSSLVKSTTFTLLGEVREWKHPISTEHTLISTTDQSMFGLRNQWGLLIISLLLPRSSEIWTFAWLSEACNQICTNWMLKVNSDFFLLQHGTASVAALVSSILHLSTSVSKIAFANVWDMGKARSLCLLLGTSQPPYTAQPRAATSSRALAWAEQDSAVSPFHWGKAVSFWLTDHCRGMGESLEGGWLWLCDWVSLTALPKPWVEKYGNSSRRQHSSDKAIHRLTSIIARKELLFATQTQNSGYPLLLSNSNQALTQKRGESKILSDPHQLTSLSTWPKHPKMIWNVQG